MFNKIIKYRFWISGGIIFFLGVWFLGAMLKTAGVTRSEPDKESLLYQAKQYYLDGAYKKASSLYEKILILEPNSASATLDLAIIYDDYLGRKDRAVEFYRRYLELEPEAEKKELVEEWMIQAAQESLGIHNLGNETYENRLSKMEEELDGLKKEKIRLEKEVETLSSKLYTIQAEHQKEIQILQGQRERLSIQISNARMRISDLSKALQSAEKAKKEMQDELEKTLKFQKRPEEPGDYIEFLQEE